MQRLLLSIHITTGVAEALRRAGNSALRGRRPAVTPTDPERFGVPGVGSGRLPRRAIRRLIWLAIPLALLGAGFIGGLVRERGPAGSDTATRTTVWPSACPGPGTALLPDRSHLSHGSDARNLVGSQGPLPFDCGTGEVWRRHVP